VAVKKIIVDASIVVKWYLKENDSEQALRLRDDHVSGRITITVPALLEYEVLNALKHSEAYSETELIDIAHSLNKYGFESWRLNGRLKDETVRASSKYDVTMYDASYIALAILLRVPFYTADDELLSKVARLKIAKHVREA